MEPDGDLEKKPLLVDEKREVTSKEECREQKSPGTQACVMWIALVFYSCGISAGMGTMKQYTYKAVGDYYNLTGTDSESMQNKANSEGGCGANMTSSKSNHQEAANWLLYFELTEYSFVIPVVAICGIYSDFWGRKPFILLSSVGTVLEYGFFAICIYFHMSLPFLLIGYAIGGITGSEHVLFMSCCASMADTTEVNKSRSFYMACIYLCLGLGISVAQLGIGFAINYFGFVIPNVIAVSVSIISVLLFWNMPETYQNRNQHRSFGQSLSRLIGFYHDKSYLKNTAKWKFLLCLIAFILCLSPIICRSNVETLYQLGEPFCFTSEQIGYYSALKEIVQLSFGTLLLRLLHFCLNDEIIMYFGCLSAIAYFTMEGFAINSWMIYLGAVCGTMCTLPIPLMRSFLSRMVHEDKQGAVFANMYVVETGTELFSNSLFLSIYANTQSFMQGFVFVVFSIFYLVFGIAFIPIAVSHYRQRSALQELDVPATSINESSSQKTEL